MTPAQIGSDRRVSLFPERHDDLAVSVEDQVDPVRVVNLSLDPVRRRDRTIVGRQIATVDNSRTCLPLTLFDELLADAFLAVVSLDLGLRAAGQLLDLKRVAVGANP